MGRRSVLAHLGKAAAAAGVVSLVLPSPAAAASCSSSATACQGDEEPLGRNCNPPTCSGTVIRQWTAFSTGPEILGNVFCAGSLGPSAMAACDNTPNAVQLDCNQAKREMEQISAAGPYQGIGRYYCASNVAATCALVPQCRDDTGRWLNSSCCNGGTCRSNGTCS